MKKVIISIALFVAFFSMQSKAQITFGVQKDTRLIRPYKYKSNINYLEIPVNGLYKFGAGPAIIFIQAGPYLGYALSAKLKADEKIFQNEDGTLTDKYDLKIGTDKEKDDLKPLDFGINVGAGVEFKGITFGLQYGLGLANISPYTEDDTKIKNKVIGISVGYKFIKN
ncbi:MAG: porin family protein [Bacteroidetes bacterium]|nr:porin family protein [Bacteroidota bacterium]